MGPPARVLDLGGSNAFHSSPSGAERLPGSFIRPPEVSVHGHRSFALTRSALMADTPAAELVFHLVEGLAA